MRTTPLPVRGVPVSLQGLKAQTLRHLTDVTWSALRMILWFYDFLLNILKYMMIKNQTNHQHTNMSRGVGDENHCVVV